MTGRDRAQTGLSARVAAWTLWYNVAVVGSYMCSRCGMGWDGTDATQRAAQKGAVPTAQSKGRTKERERKASEMGDDAWTRALPMRIRGGGRAFSVRECVSCDYLYAALMTEV
jgi:rubredoxin